MCGCSSPRVKFSGVVQSSVNPGRSARVSCLCSDHISGNAGGLRHCYVQRGTYCSIRTDMPSTAETYSAGYSETFTEIPKMDIQSKFVIKQVF